MAKLKTKDGQMICEIDDRYILYFLSAGLIVQTGEEDDVPNFEATPRTGFFGALRRIIHSGDLDHADRAEQGYLQLGLIFDMYEAEIRHNFVRYDA